MRRRYVAVCAWVCVLSFASAMGTKLMADDVIRPSGVAANTTSLASGLLRLPTPTG